MVAKKDTCSDGPSKECVPEDVTLRRTHNSPAACGTTRAEQMIAQRITSVLVGMCSSKSTAWRYAEPFGPGE